MDTATLQQWADNAPTGYVLAPVSLDYQFGAYLWAYVARDTTGTRMTHWNGFEMPVISRVMLDAQADAMRTMFPAGSAEDGAVEYIPGVVPSLWRADDAEDGDDGEYLKSDTIDGREFFALGDGWVWVAMTVFLCDSCAGDRRAVGFAGRIACETCGASGTHEFDMAADEISAALADGL